MCSSVWCESAELWARWQRLPSDSKWLNWKLFPNVAWQPNLPGLQKERGKDLRLCCLNCSYCLLSEDRPPSHKHIIMKRAHTHTSTQKNKTTGQNTFTPSKRETLAFVHVFQVDVAILITIEMRAFLQCEENKLCLKSKETTATFIGRLWPQELYIFNLRTK